MHKHYSFGLYKKFQNKHISRSKQDFSEMMKEIYEKVYACDSKQYVALPLANNYMHMFSDLFDPCTQQDSHMFLMYLFEKL